MADSINRQIIEIVTKTMGVQESEKALKNLETVLKRQQGIAPSLVGNINLLDHQYSRLANGLLKVKDIFQSTDGQLYNATYLAQQNGQEVTALGNVYLKTQNNVAGFAKEVNKTNPLLEQFGLAFKRALIVAPLWMAARTVLQSFFNTIKEGMDTVVQFEGKMVNLKAILGTGLASNTKYINDLSDSFYNLSIKTGLAVTRIQDIFAQLTKYNFADDIKKQIITVADSFEDIFGNVKAEDITNIIAQTFFLLGKTFDKTKTDAENLNSVTLQLFRLLKSGGTAGTELVSSFSEILPVASQLGISFDELVNLMTAFSKAAPMAGVPATQLKTFFVKLIDKTDEIGSKFGIFRKEGESTGQFIARFAQELKSLSSVDMQGTLSNLQEIFGMKGIVAANTLKIASDELKKMQSDTTTLTDLQDNYNKSAKEADNTLGEIGKKLAASKTAASAGFFKSFVDTAGVKDLAKGWTSEQGRGVLSNIGTTLAMPIKGLQNLIAGSTRALFEQKPGESLGKRFQNLFTYILRPDIQPDLPETQKQIEKVQNKIKEIINSKTNKTEIKLPEITLNTNQLEEYRKMKKDFGVNITKTLGLNEQDLLLKNIKKEIEDINEIFKTKTDTQKYGLATLSQEELLYKVLSGDVQSLVNYWRAAGKEADRVMALVKIGQDYQVAALSDKLTNINKVLENEAQIAKMKGAEDIQILEWKIEILKQLYGSEQATQQLLDLKYEKEKLITQEKLNQKNLSQEEIQIYQIAKKQGKDVAQEVSSFLAGTKGLKDLSETAQRTLKGRFSGKVEETQAADFFEQNKDLLLPKQLRAEAAGMELKSLNEITVQPMQIKVNLDSESIVQGVMAAIEPKLAASLNKTGSTLNKADKKNIEDF